LVSSVNTGRGSIRDRSFATVTSSGSMSQPNFHLDLCPVASWNKLARSPVNCYELETGALLKKIDTGWVVAAMAIILVPVTAVIILVLGLFGIAFGRPKSAFNIQSSFEEPFIFKLVTH
jgi:hypothetical protein